MEQTGLPPVNLLYWLIAVLPILVLLFSMFWLGWNGSKAGPFGFLVAFLLSFFYGATFKVLVSGIVKGIWATIWMLYIIWPAMLIYNVADKSGGIKTIGATFTALTGDLLLQLLLIGWVFPSFLQGVTGFGTPVAVAAPLLVGLGYSPILAAAVPLIGHSWAVTFGSMGSSYFMAILMAKFDPRSAAGFANWAALMLGLCCLLVGFSVAYVFDGWKAVRKGIMVILLVSIIMAMVLNLMVRIEPSVASFTAGIFGLLTCVLLAKIVKAYRPRKRAVLVERVGEPSMPPCIAFAPYIIMIIVVLGMLLPPSISNWAKRTLVLGFPFPETRTTWGFINKAEKVYTPLRLLAHPGTFILVAALGGFVVYRLTGHWKKGTRGKVGRSLVEQTMPSTIAIVSMVIMSTLMVESGMTTLLARGAAAATRSLYPLISVWIGVLGAFMTGSNTASNTLFAAFQRDVAILIGVSPWILVAAQTTGGGIGNMVCPYNVLLGATTAGALGKEAMILKRTATSCIIQCLVIGILTWFFVYVIPILPAGP